MKVTIALAALAIALGVRADQPAIQTPAAQQCSPTLLMLSGGVPPYQISALPAGQTTAPPIEIIVANFSGSSFTWNTNIAAGTSITLQIKDSTGAENFSSQVTIQPGTDSSCLSSSAGGSSTTPGSSTSGASSSGSTAPTSSSPSSASSTPVGGTTSSPSGASTTGGATSSTAKSSGNASGSSTSTSPASSTTNSSAASALTSGSAAGIIGALLAALLA